MIFLSLAVAAVRSVKNKFKFDKFLPIISFARTDKKKTLKNKWFAHSSHVATHYSVLGRSAVGADRRRAMQTHAAPVGRVSDCIIIYKVALQLMKFGCVGGPVASRALLQHFDPLLCVAHSPLPMASYNQYFTSSLCFHDFVKNRNICVCSPSHTVHAAVVVAQYVCCNASRVWRGIGVPDLRRSVLW